MAVDFTSITFEAELDTFPSSGWTDITRDVLADPRPRWNRGVMDNGPLDRVADPGILNFCMNNSETNSAGLLGLYTPGHANCLDGWKVGIPVRLSFGYGGYTIYKYKGYIAPDGLTTDPGIYGPRKVHVTCRDYAAIVADSKLNLLAPVATQTVAEAVPLILANMPFAPALEVYSTNTNVEFPTVFDAMAEGASAASEMQKLCMSDGLGTFVFVIGSSSTVAYGETLKLQTRWTVADTTGDLVLYDGSTAAFDANDIMFGKARISYGRHFANRIYVASYPKNTDTAATTVLWSLKKSFNLAASQSVIIRATYRDPNAGADYVSGTAMVTPAATTDYTANTDEDGGGTSKTAALTVTASYGAASAAFTCTNSTTSEIWVTKLQCRGKGVYRYDKAEVLYEDATSQLKHGVIPLTIDMPYQTNAWYADHLGTHYIGELHDPVPTLDGVTMFANRDDLNMYGFLQLEPGEQASFAETMNAVSGHYYINGYDAEIVAKRWVYWTPVLHALDYYST